LGNARQLFTDKVSKYIPFDQPDFVVNVIREVYKPRANKTGYRFDAKESPQCVV